ncbi:DNA-binding transcriptional LysR family regulator [Pseudomonas fluvialis]|uniref:DNA-binding transcriptional LysR family regulator n=1 Tax=Pseudomonas fluvialis TaxID=1793966 RepID=A0A7X0BV19_9PSED|nr:LysR family transcriptional regulator [Pseudomonas fluvialis]MBB6341996.1 DNA-binding transcriptional LysR family regulator [Pseudomonas fluvialis]
MSDLRQLRHFVALAEHGHFARAAEAVHLSQPAFSRSIQGLEGSLGCVLVDRHSRGISLTAHGRLVLEHAQRLLAGSRALTNAVSQLGNLASGELHLGAGPFPAARLVPRVLGRFAELHPAVHLRLLIDNWQQLRERLLQGQLEIFVADVRELRGDPLLSVNPLPSYPGVLFCSPQHPLLDCHPLRLPDVLAYPLASTQLPAEISHALRAVSGREALSIECDNFMVLKELVSQSHVLSIAPWDVVAHDVSAGRLATLRLEGARMAQGSAYGIVTLAGHSLSPGAAELHRLLLNQQDESDLPIMPD